MSKKSRRLRKAKGRCVLVPVTQRPVPETLLRKSLPIICLCWQVGSINVDYPHLHINSQRKKEAKKEKVVMVVCIIM